MAWRAVWTALAVCLMLLTTTRVARAEQMVVVVRVERPGDETLFNRVLGQTSDLPVKIVREADAPKAVVWFDTAATGEITVFIAVPDAKTQLVQRVGHDAGSASAMLESASLIVRDALQSLLAGHPVGAPTEDAPKSDPEPPPPLTLVKPKRPRPSPPPPPLAWRAFTAIGARVVFPDATPSYATTYRLGVARGNLEAGIALTLGATDVDRDSLAALRIRRHALGAFGGWSTRISDELRASLDVNAGVMLFVRATRPIDPGLEPSATEPNVHAFVGPEARVAWEPGPTWLHVAFAVGFDGVFLPPAFSYDGTGTHALEVWAIQPHFTVLLELGARR